MHLARFRWAWLAASGVLLSCGNHHDSDQVSRARTASVVDVIEDASFVALAPRPDGGALVLRATDRRTELRAYASDAERDWSFAVDIEWSNLPFAAPAVAVGADGSVYLSVISDLSEGIRVGDLSIACPEVCTGLAAFNGDGEPRWLVKLPYAQSRYLAARGDGVVIAATDVGLPPTLIALDAQGEIAWQRDWAIVDPWRAVIDGDGFIAGDASGDLYVAGSREASARQGGVCAVLARIRAGDGSLVWEREVCDEKPRSYESFSNAVVLADGAVAVLASGPQPSKLVAFDALGDDLFSLPLPYAQRPAFGDAAGLVTLATGIGPVARVDSAGDPRWQWPGAVPLDGAEFALHPSGLCQGRVAPAAGRQIYALTRGCASALALLGQEATPVDGAWFLARIDVEAGGVEPRCGNGWLDPGEECDGQDFDAPREPRDGAVRPALCGGWLDGNGWTNAPTCTDSCRVDLSACDTTCGNGQLDEEEWCDGELFRYAQSCDEAGLGSGPLGCNACEVDLSVCPMRASCGNGQLEDWEMCDGQLINGPSTCEEAGIAATGLIGCSEDCREIDFSACEL